MAGFTHGFELHYDGPRVAMEAKNLKSAIENPTIVTDKLTKEVNLGRMAGPFSTPPLENFRVSPVGLVSKKSGNEYRLIHHLSHPENQSVNDYIDPTLCSVNYTHFDEAVEMVQQLGKNADLAKLDISSAFKLLPISPADFELLGIKHDGFYYYDKTLPFGVSIACATFEKNSTFLEWAGRKHSESDNIRHYLDDFLIGGKAGTTECKHVMDTFIGVCDHLSVPLATEKTEGPTTRLCFLGLDIDSAEMYVQIPHNKLLELREKVKYILSRGKSHTERNAITTRKSCVCMQSNKTGQGI
ncbi:MAG: reverse transcriptase domain-containing protein [Sedimenticola sp.]